MTWNDLISEPLLLVLFSLLAILGLVILGLIVWMIWDRFRPRMTKGIVCDKEYAREHDELNFLPMTMPTPQGGISTTLLPQYTSCDDEWLVTIEGQFRGKMRREEYSVTEEFYNEVQIGSFVDFDED